MKNPFRYFKTSPEIIRLAVMMYVRFPLSLRNVEDLLHERGIKVSHETIRFWWNRFGPIFAAEIRKERMDRMRPFSGWRWHLDEVFVKINGERHYLWRAVDQEGEVLEAFVSKKRDRKAALKFLRKLMKRYPRPNAIVTDQLSSYRAALRQNERIRSASSRPLAEQSGGEFTSAVSATRTRHARFQADAKPPEIRRRSFFPSTTTSICDDTSAHGTISRSNAPPRSPSGVRSRRPNFLSSVENSALRTFL